MHPTIATFATLTHYNTPITSSSQLLLSSPSNCGRSLGSARRRFGTSSRVVEVDARRRTVRHSPPVLVLAPVPELRLAVLGAVLGSPEE